ncbi:MAG: hypothetical protein LQ351_001347 [Letrouitia transgressa]|nr:MAG: hypothetical protein LQ351_001347 [Letrouitia transgressa]
MDQLAHAYGEITLGAESTDPDDCGSFTDIQSIIDSTKDYRYYCRRNTSTQEFGIRFNEYNVNDTQRTYPHFTNRVITAFAEPCNEYLQVGEPKKTNVGNPQRDGTNFISAFNYTYAINNTTNGSLVIPTSALGDRGTTYIYRGSRKPPNAVRYAHGDRGLLMWAYRNPAGIGRTSRFYECPVTVGIIANIEHPAHNISDSMAREAVASIALQGQFKSGKKSEDKVFTQWQWYAVGHHWNIKNYHKSSRVGVNMAEHAIVSLAEMVANNPKIKIPGTVPYLGSKLKVDWHSFAALMAGIVAWDCLASVLGLLLIWNGPKSQPRQWVKLKDIEPVR